MKLRRLGRVGELLLEVSACASLLAWILSRPASQPVTPPQVPPATSPPLSLARATPAWVLAPEPPTPPAPAVGWPATEETIRAWRPSPVATAPLAYERAVASITQAAVSDRAKAQALLALLPRVPEEALSPTTEEATHWLRAADYADLAAPLLVDAHTHGAVLGVLFADLMTRPDAITLPVLLQIARTPEHPFSHSAQDNLRLLLGEDLGQDWPAWEQAVRQRPEFPPP